MLRGFSLTLLIGCSSGGGARARFVATDDALADCGVSTFTESARFDEVYRKACHNCYERDRAPSLTAALDQVRSIEIDIWDDAHLLVGGARPGAWYVRHGLMGGNRSNCSGTGDFAACLGDVKAWSDGHPGHEVVTVYVDKKQGWGARRRPVDFDALLEHVFSRARVYAPADLRGRHATLREAAEAGAWPDMDALRGKVLFVLTGGGFLTPNTSQHEYVAAQGSRALSFVAPDTDAPEQVVGVPARFDRETAAWVVFYNLDRNAGFLGPTVRARHYVTRMWGVDEDGPLNRECLAHCVNFVAADHLEKTAAADLHGVLVPRSPR